METFEYLIVLDYNTGELFYKKLNDSDIIILDESDDSHSLLHKYGFNEDTCCWMVTPIKPELNKIEDKDE